MIAYKASKEIISKLYPKCFADEAWNVGNIRLFEECSTEIIASNSRIKSTLPKIEVFTQVNSLNLSIQAEIGQLMENVKMDPYYNDGLEVAIAYIKQKTSESPSINCSEVEGCLESTRKIVVQLKMIEWRLFGIGQATAGLYLAQHFSTLGPYFGDNEGRNPNSHH